MDLPSQDRSENQSAQKKRPGRVQFTDTVDTGSDRDGDFDPDTARNLQLPLTNIETFLHLLKSLLGTGILAMPKAFYYSGWMVGIIGSILIAMISTYCVHILIKSQYEVCKRQRVSMLSYMDTAKKAMQEGPKLFVRFSKGFGFLAGFFLVIDQIGTCCVYIIFVASNLKGVVDQYIEPLDIRIYMTALLVPLLLLNYIRNLKFLAPFSTLANLFMLVSFGITFYYVFSDLPPVASRKIVGNLHDFPLFIGMVLFSMEAIGVVLPLRNDMKHPKSFGGLFGILNLVMVVLCVSYVTIGFFGYIKYGDATKGSITLNLPDRDGMAQAVRIMLSCSVLLSHALQCYVIIDIVWNENLSYRFYNRRWKMFCEYITRTVIVIVTFLLAVAIPNLELFISLVGALCVTLLAILFPVMIETATFWHQKRGSAFHIMCLKNLLLAAFGLVALFIGVYMSLVEIFQAIRPH